MHRREVTAAQFAALSAELVDVMRYPTNFDLLSGHHEDCGHVILLRTRSFRVALVDHPSWLDGDEMVIQGQTPIAVTPRG